MTQSNYHSVRYIVAALAAWLCFSCAPCVASDSPEVALVRGATQNEISATASPDHNHLFMYKNSTVYKDHAVTKQVIETPQGGLTRVISKNGHPLSPDEQTKEDEKLKKFANDSEARRKKEQSSKEDDERAAVLMKSLPDAFFYTLVGTEKGPSGHELVRLNFTANPNWTAPNHETRVLEGMNGNMLIDKTAMRLAEINGELFKDVDFGWGILGRLDKGGRFIIHQADVGNGKWEGTLETLQFTGKIMMVKTLTIWSTETSTDFRPVPPTSQPRRRWNCWRKATTLWQ